MKNAVSKLNTPLDTGNKIPTTVDTRADADTVIKTMDQAKREASQALESHNLHLHKQARNINH